jgi:Ni,Fe-hydrogenase I large subunit
MLVAYLNGVKPVVEIVDVALAKLGATGKPEVLVSLLGRIAARNLETKVVADWAIEWVDELIGAAKSGDVKLFETSDASAGDGAGMWEAPRGALGHWMNVSGGRIENYQVCTPSTWNIGGRDDQGVTGVIEEALIGAPCIDTEKPMEAARIVRSFDP